MPRDTTRRGRHVELLVIAILVAQGYTVHRCLKAVAWTKHGPRSLGQDVFGCIDLIAKKAGEPTRWIQVFSGRHIGRKIHDLQAVPWTDAHDSVELWRWVGGRHRIDRRSGLPCPRQFFQLYRRSKNFEADKTDRIQT